MTQKKKSVSKKVKSPKKGNLWEHYKAYIIPSALGAAIALLVSRSIELGSVVFIAVWIGNLVARVYLVRHK